MNFYYVYVLKSLKDSKNYIGFTNNLLQRYTEHEQGRNISTAKRRPLELIFMKHLEIKKMLYVEKLISKLQKEKLC